MKLIAYSLTGLVMAFATTLATAAPLADQQETRLWASTAPGSENLTLVETATERSKDPAIRDRAYTNVLNPTMTAYVAAKPNGTALLIMPGGAYARVVTDKEGVDIARAMNAKGITAFVLKYRLPGEGHANRQNVPLQDAQRAIRLIRANAAEWKLDASRVGVIGMSAGGNLAATLGTQFDKAVYTPRDEADKLSARPDFLGLLYPVISMTDKLTHAQSRELLLGSKQPAPELIAEFSAEQHVTKTTPPSFLACANDDTSVPPDNSVSFYRALRASGVPAEIHVFRASGHGFGIRQATGSASEWPNLFAAWLGANNMMP
ncbi:alpha/beta hydrolase [Uliginosibacterium sp. 31-16]|uniref:alpha/beta hydrolase n=1 Tax=Uliginosibacterium sp. 31-16 TaxID=3068315 RepID=UPI00273E3BF3|nr:alpha/beta hydrolase [Uliginosibacterium sp. 31-16]MDP5239026.1 alpha/beta hydrolase [Uliginosibacterium sp. 31-16]